jgi:uncharacterized membrane protein
MLLALIGLCLGVRWAGFLAASRTGLPPKLERLISSIPAPLLAALVASSAASQGMSAIIAVAAALLLMVVMGNEIVAAAVGVGLALLLT